MQNPCLTPTISASIVNVYSQTYNMCYRVSQQVIMEASIIDNHTTTPSDGFVEKGLTFGARVKTVARRTVEFGPKKFRKDVPKGYQAKIKGFVDGKIIIGVTSTVGGKEMSTDVACKAEGLTPVAGAAAAAGAEAPSSSSGPASDPKCMSGFEFLGDRTQFELLKNWGKQLTASDQDLQSTRFKETCGFVLRNLNAHAPEYGEKDCHPPRAIRHQMHAHRFIVTEVRPYHFLWLTTCNFILNYYLEISY